MAISIDNPIKSTSIHSPILESVVCACMDAACAGICYFITFVAISTPFKNPTLSCQSNTENMWLL